MISPVLRNRSRRGSSLIEIMASAAILGIIGAATMRMVITVRHDEVQTSTYLAKDRELQTLIESIGSNVQIFQTTFDPAPLPGTTFQGTHWPSYCSPQMGSESNVIADCILSQSGPEGMPVAWSNSQSGDIESCPECLGRLGYVIQPMQGFNGLYLVTVRFKHKSLTNDRNLEYRFFTSNR